MKGTVIDLLTPAYPVRIRVAVPGLARCGKCNGVALAVLDVSDAGGYSAGSDYEHDPNCPSLFCAHGVAWRETCNVCDLAEEAARVARAEARIAAAALADARARLAKIDEEGGT